MTLAETIEAHVEALPVHLQREALDFIAFLEARHGIAPQIVAADVSAMATERFIACHAGALGADFPDDIDGTDIGIDFPREALE